MTLLEMYHERVRLETLTLSDNYVVRAATSISSHILLEARHLYDALFAFVVSQINATVSVPCRCLTLPACVRHMQADLDSVSLRLHEMRPNSKP